MKRSPVFTYAVGTAMAFTFSSATHQGRLYGHVLAPEGAELRVGGTGGHLKLKTPKPTRPHEFWLMTARDAAESAQEGKDGLRWEPAGRLQGAAS